MFSNDRSIKLTFHNFTLCFALFYFSNYSSKDRSYYYFFKYYSSSIVLWGFICHIFIVDCWTVCLHWFNQRSFIINLVLGCVGKLSMCCIQTGHPDSLPPQVCGRLGQGCRLGVQTCLLQYIAWIFFLWSPSNSLFNPFLVYCWLVCIAFIE